MEEKKSTVSASSTKSETDSPPARQPRGGGSGRERRRVACNGGTSAAAATPGNVDSLVKKKRHREYDDEGNLRLSSAGVKPPVEHPGTTPISLSSASPSEFSSSSSSERGRGRPPGSGNGQLLDSVGKEHTTTAGTGNFKPHVVTVDTGEDISSKLHALAEKGPRGVYVLSAAGAVSQASIFQPGRPRLFLRYKRGFEIVSLCGSLTFDDDGVTIWGSLSASLIGVDGYTISGTAGVLIADGPIQVWVRSFKPNSYKAQEKKHQREDTMASPPSPTAPYTLTVATPISPPKHDVFQAGLTPTPPALPPQTHVEPEKNMATDKEN